MEEMAREEFFRLKKILEIKKKIAGRDCGHRTPVENCDKCKNKFTKPIDDECVVCGKVLPVLPKLEPAEDAKISAADSTAYENMLELFKKNIGDIIEVTEDVKGKGITAESVEKFLMTANELREKLGKKTLKITEESGSAVEGGTTIDKGSLVDAGPAGEVTEHKKVCEGGHLEQISSDVSIQKLCDSCINRFEAEQAAKGAKLEKIREEQEQSAKLSKKKELEIPVDLELGVFETEYQTVTKIIRVKKEDGTITEETKVIKTKKETKAPAKPRKPKDEDDDDTGRSLYRGSGTSSKSSAYPSHSRTVGMVSVQDRSFLKSNKAYISRKAKSEMMIYVSSMTSPAVRNCISSASMLSVNANFNLSCIAVIGSGEQNYRSDVTLKELYASSSEVQIAVDSINQSEPSTTSNTTL